MVSRRGDRNLLSKPRPSPSAEAVRDDDLPSEWRAFRYEQGTEEVQVRVAGDARVAHAAILYNLRDLPDAVLDVEPRIKTECGSRLLTRDAIVAEVLKWHFGELGLDVGIERGDPLGEPADGHVLALQVEDPSVLAEQRRDNGLRRIAHVQQRAILLASEHADSPVKDRFDRKQVEDEIHADTRIGVAHPVNRPEPEDDRVASRECRLGFDLGLGVQGERVQRRVLCQEAVLRSVHRAGRHEDDPPVERLAKPSNRVDVDRSRELRVESAGPVTDHRRQPHDGIGPLDVRAQRIAVEDASVHEADLLEVVILVEENVEDAHVVTGLADPVGQPAADVASAAYDENVAHAARITGVSEMVIANPGARLELHMSSVPDTTTSAGAVSESGRGWFKRYRLPGSWAIPAAAGLAALLLTAGVLAWGSHDRPTLHVDATFSGAACCTWQVWLNENLKDITIFPIYTGRHTYDVPLITPTIARLRMPVGQAPTGTFTLHRLWVTRGSTTVAEADPATLRITPYSAEEKPASDGAAFTAVRPNPFLDVPVTLKSGESRFRVLVARTAAQPVTALGALLLLCCIALAALALFRRQWTLAVSLATAAFIVRLLPKISWHLPLRDSVAQAVSYASYQGLWKTRERFVLDAAALTAIVVPAVVLLARRAWRHRHGDRGVVATREPEIHIGRQSRPVAAALVAAPIVIVALSGAPNLRLFIGGPPQYAPSWDANNLIFWHYLIERVGLAPMKDFFWPYGFQWLFDRPVPWGELMSYLTYLSLWAFLALGTYLTLARFFTGRGLVLRFVLLSGLWVSAVTAGYTLFTTRYIAGLGVLLLYAGIDPAERQLSWKRAVFAVALFEVAVFEIAQVVYAVVPIAMLVAAEAAFAYRRNLRSLRQVIARSGLWIVVPLGGAALTLWATGELGGTFDYYSQLSALTASYGLPGQLDAWVTDPTNLEGILFWSVPITIAAGGHGVLARAGRLRELYLVVLALGVLSFMIMQKQALRPSIATQIWLPVVFPLAFWAVVESRGASTRRWTAVAATAGAIIAVVLVAGGYKRTWQTVVEGPHRLATSVDALVTDRTAFTATARKDYAPAAFANFTAYKQVVRTLSTMPPVRTGKPVWILGDDSPIIMMLGLKWPYYFNDFYDATPLAFQRRVLSSLAEHPPALTVWNFAPGTMSYDTVPNVVRSPLIFQWAVANLAPQRTVGTFAILRPRQTDEPIRLSWWRRRIGRTVDLGHIPVVANLPGGSCTRSCDDFLVVKVPSDQPIPAAFEIPVRAGGLEFALKFAASPGERRYVVPLDRLWFWPAARTHTVLTDSATGLDLRVERHPRRPGTLY
jgi:hypothetical protein